MSDELWSLIEPLRPEPAPKLVEGRPRVPDRQALCGILFLLHTGIQWVYLLQELGFGSGMTGWRGLAAWNEASVWDQLHVVRLEKLQSKNQLDWSRAVIDSFHVRAARRGPKAVPARSHTAGQQTPPHRRRAGHPARGVVDRRQPQRRHSTPATARQDPGRRGQGRQTPPTAGRTAGRSRLRPRQVPPPALAARDPPRDRGARPATRHRPGHLPLRRRAHKVRSITHRLGSERRWPLRRGHDHGLREHEPSRRRLGRPPRAGQPLRLRPSHRSIFAGIGSGPEHAAISCHVSGPLTPAERQGRRPTHLWTNHPCRYQRHPERANPTLTRSSINDPTERQSP